MNLDKGFKFFTHVWIIFFNMSMKPFKNGICLKYFVPNYMKLDKLTEIDNI